MISICVTGAIIGVIEIVYNPRIDKVNGLWLLYYNCKNGRDYKIIFDEN